MGASVSPEPLSDHDLYDHFRDRGLSHADAVKHVELRRTAAENAMTPNPAESGQPGLLPALIVGLGHGASQGLLSGQAQGPATAQSFPTSRGAPPIAGFGGTGYQIGPPTPDENYAQYLASAREAYPWPMRGAEAAGGMASAALMTPFVAGQTAAKGAAILGAGSGALRGTVDPLPGFTRTESALLLGAGGAVTSGVATKLVSKLLPIAVTIGKDVSKALGISLGKAAAPEAKQIAEQLTEAAFRAELKRLNVRPQFVERTVQAWKTGKVPQGPIDFPPMEPTVSRVGETVTPLEPQLPTLRAQADVMATQPAYVRAGNPNNLPTGTGPMAPPQAGMPLGVPGTLQALEQHLGRPLTPPETQSVLERLLGPAGALPRSYGRPP